MGWWWSAAFRTSTIRLLSPLASKYIPVCSRLLMLASLFPQLQPTKGTLEAEAGRMCAVGKGVLNVMAPT